MFRILWMAYFKKISNNLLATKRKLMKSINHDRQKPRKGSKNYSCTSSSKGSKRENKEDKWRKRSFMISSTK